MNLGIGLSLTNIRGGGEPPVITATTAPSLASLADGGTLSTAVTWGSYASSEGTITGTVREMSVNSAAFVAYDGTVTVSALDTYQLRETVSDDAGNSRPFFTGTRTVAGVAPTITASSSIASDTLTITVDSLAGTPAPTATLTTLTVDGSSVLGGQSGTGPWTYDTSALSDGQVVAWEVTASNGVSPDATASGLETIAPAPAIANPFVDYDIAGTAGGPSDIKGLRLSTDGGSTWNTMTDLGITATYPADKTIKLSGGQWASVTHIHFEQEDGESYVATNGVEDIPALWPDNTFPRPENVAMPGVPLSPTDAAAPIGVS